MERLTERFDNGQAAVMGCGENCKYDYKYCRNHYEDCPEINRLYERLAEYEDAGLTPEQIMELKARDEAVEINEIHVDEYYCPACGSENNCDQGNDGWIPAEERLPKEKKSVLVQWEKYDRHLNVTLTYLDVMWLEDEEDVVFETINGIPNGRVIAWRPLPEPYKSKRSEE